MPPIDWKTWVSDWSLWLWETYREERTEASEQLAETWSIFANKVGKITTGEHKSQEQDSNIYSRLNILDWDAIKVLFSEYIKKHKLGDINILNDRKHFYLSNFYSTISTNKSDLWINDINLFTKKQLGLLCWVLYWESSNAIIQYQAELQQQ